MHPRIILEYHGINGDLETKSIELGSLDPETDVDALVKKLVREEGLISESNKADFVPVGRFNGNVQYVQ